MRTRFLVRLAIAGAVLATGRAAFPEDPPARPVPESLRDAFGPPAAFADDLGPYRPVTVFDDGTPVKTAADWARRREEIRRAWHAILGPWPELLESPRAEVLATERRDGLTEHRVRVPIAPGRTTVGYLLVPDGAGPFPAVLVPFYTPETPAGRDDKQGRDHGYQLARRGFVTLSIGWPDAQFYPDFETARLQPLSFMAYVAANCCNVLAGRDDVDAARIGVVGHSLGGKWALFAAALHDGFACGVWSDPGIAFDETRANVNYWDQWYLGYEPGQAREIENDPPAYRFRGLPGAGNPRRGAYKALVEAGHDLHELHALMAPRPLLVSGGAVDPPERWRVLNHAIAVNRLLGSEDRVAMTNRPMHGPRPEDNAAIVAFLEHVLK